MLAVFTVKVAGISGFLEAGLLKVKVLDEDF